jgi:hypothetical protein
MTAGLNVPRIKQNVFDYWQSANTLNWPVKVVSAQRGQQMQAVIGGLVNVRGFITSEKFVRGRTPDQMETVLGMPQGEYNQGVYVFRLLCLPLAHQFDLKGYSQTPDGMPYTGGRYPPGLGANQWDLTDDLLATVVAFVPPGQRF